MRSNCYGDEFVIELLHRIKADVHELSFKAEHVKHSDEIWLWMCFVWFVCERIAFSPDYNSAFGPRVFGFRVVARWSADEIAILINNPDCGAEKVFIADGVIFDYFHVAPRKLLFRLVRLHERVYENLDVKDFIQLALAPEFSTALDVGFSEHLAESVPVLPKKFAHQANKVFLVIRKKQISEFWQRFVVVLFFQTGVGWRIGELFQSSSNELEAKKANGFQFTFCVVGVFRGSTRVVLHPHTRADRVAVAEDVVHAADVRPEFVVVQALRRKRRLFAAVRTIPIVRRGVESIPIHSMKSPGFNPATFAAISSVLVRIVVQSFVGKTRTASFRPAMFC